MATLLITYESENGQIHSAAVSSVDETQIATQELMEELASIWVDVQTNGMGQLISVKRQWHSQEWS